MSTTNDQAAPAVPVQSPADAAGPGVADYAGVVEELRRLRDEAKAASDIIRIKAQQEQSAYHSGRMAAYAKCLRLLSGEDKPEPQPVTIGTITHSGTFTASEPISTQQPTQKP